jgi:predicted NAD/FAD-dependent oxidoreductase
MRLKPENIEIHALSPKARNVLNAFFQVIHPGEIEDYLPAFQAHAFFRYRPVHYPDGNGGLIQAYLERIRARVECGAEVISIQKTGQHICLSFKQHGQVMEAHARSVIVATPAPIAAALVPDMREQCRRFLQAVCYGRFTVAALGLCRFSCEQDFSYIVTPALPATTIYKMTFPGSAMTILLFYYCDRASKAYWQASDEDLITLTKECAARAGLKIVEPDLLFTDVARWEHGGTIISPEMYSDWNADALQPVPGIYLAGDYLYRDFPYGMEAAVRSGIEIAQQVRSFLRRKL